MPKRRPTPVVSALLAKAHSLLQTGRHAEAIGILTQAARLEPKNVGILNDLGLACLYSGRLDEAFAWLRRAAALQPEVAFVHHNVAVALRAAGDREAALAAVEHALSLDPAAPHGQALRADLLLECGRRREAAASYRRAAVLLRGNSIGRLCKAMALRVEGNDHRAEAELQQLVERHPDCSRAHYLLGRILEETGRFEEARAAFRRALAADPCASDAYSGLVAQKMTEGDRDVLQQILAQLAKNEPPRTLTTPQRMTLHFAAGKALEDLGDYAAAFAHFRAANSLRRKLAPRFDGERLRATVDGLIKHYNREFISRNRHLGCESSAPILIVGMPRSGTTLVERVLSAHSRIRGAGELDFWRDVGPPIALASQQELAQSVGRLAAAYLGVLGLSPEADRATDKMPFNFFWVGLVHLVFPNARFIHCRRSPIDTCLSVYTTQFTSVFPFASDMADLVVYYREYQRLMKHWEAVVPADRLTALDYEDLVVETHVSARRLLEFTGMNWDPACLSPQSNRDAIKTASSWQARQPVYRDSLERWRRYEPWIGELRALDSSVKQPEAAHLPACGP
jgi:tetratricopeptide (TPR) repeat protein